MKINCIVPYIAVLIFSFLSNPLLYCQDTMRLDIVPYPEKLEILGTPINMKMANFLYRIDIPENSDLSSETKENMETALENLADEWYMELTKSTRPFFRFNYDEKLTSESYRIESGLMGVDVSFSTYSGFYYALQTLRQLADPFSSRGGIDFPRCVIEDKPHFAYRGLHLDVSRHFFSVEEVKRYIDLMSQYKYNRLHWHLTDDQGWRIEIKKYPRLQEISAFRDETIIGHGGNENSDYDGQRYGGYYTQDEVAEIIEYAQKRAVTIIPEIEMPGHARAALAAYPEYSCTGEELSVATSWGVFDHIYCSSDETMSFLKDILYEVSELFPGEYIHIGGDEAPVKKWKECEICQKKISENNLASDATGKGEHRLQTYFINEIVNYLDSLGKKAIGWDEIMNPSLDSDATIMSWRGMDGGIAAAKNGHSVIMTPTSHCYFDYYQTKADGEPLAIGGYTPLKEVYSFDPVPDELSAEESAYIIGAQANLWTEYIPDFEHLIYMAYPRALALSEVLWNYRNRNAYTGFLKRVSPQILRLRRQEFNPSDDIIELDFVRQNVNSANDQQSNSLLIQKNVNCCRNIYYTTNGSDPSESSILYTDGINVTEGMTIKAQVFQDGKSMSGIFVWDGVEE